VDVDHELRVLIGELGEDDGFEAGPPFLVWVLRSFGDPPELAVPQREVRLPLAQAQHRGDLGPADAT
jgi:hypothetical protein